MQDQLPLDVQLLKRGALVLRAIKNNLRQKILQFIHSKQRITVTEIYVALKIEQSVASQHLAILRQEGFVHTEREGKKIYYSISYKRLEQVSQTIDKLLQKA